MAAATVVTEDFGFQYKKRTGKALGPVWLNAFISDDHHNVVLMLMKVELRVRSAAMRLADGLRFATALLKDLVDVYNPKIEKIIKEV